MTRCRFDVITIPIIQKAVNKSFTSFFSQWTLCKQFYVIFQSVYLVQFMAKVSNITESKYIGLKSQPAVAIALNYSKPKLTTINQYTPIVLLGVSFHLFFPPRTANLLF